MSCVHKNKLDGSGFCRVANQHCTAEQHVACKHKRITNFDRIKLMSVDELAYFLTEDFWSCNECPEDERLSDNPLLKGNSCDMECKKHCKEWLEREAP